MRIFLFAVLGIGVLMTMAAAMLAIDEVATDDRRAALGSFVDQTITENAEDYANGSASTRGERRWDRVMHSIQSVRNGIFRNAPITLADAMPPAPPGWVRRDYTTSDGEAITGAVYERTPLATTTTNSILSRFEGSGGGTALKARATYQKGDALIALRMTGDMKRIRAAEAGEVIAAKAPPIAFARLSGIAVVEERALSTDHMTGKTTPVPYRRFTVTMDGQVEIEVLTNAATADIAALLSGIDIAAIQAGLSLKTAGYDPALSFTPPAVPENADRDEDPA